MARVLSSALDACMRDPVRLPAYRLEIYDLRSTAEEVAPTRINDVVRALQGLAVLPEIVGPRIFDADVVQATLTETAGDFVEGGPSASVLELTLVDVAAELDPLENPPTEADPEAGGRWLRQGNVVVLREGDARVDEADWPITFTGRLQGQVGAVRGRTTGQATLTARAASREVDFLRQLSTSAEFPQGTAFTDIAASLAELDMGLDPDEVALPSFSVRTTAFLSTQFVDEAPLASLAKLMFPDGFLPRFGGDGRLGASSSSIDKALARNYETAEPIRSVERPLIDQSGPNELELIGLDPTKSQVLQGRQTLATASITTGFFSRGAKIPVQWSDDGTQQARDVRMEVDSSVADGPFNFGGERFTNGTTDADGGSTRGEIAVDGGLEASLVVAAYLAGIWITSHAKPDGVVAFGTGTVSGYTIAIGRIIEGAVGQALMSMLGKIGRGQYRITGRPYEWVFQELPRIARVEGLSGDEERRAVRIENHLISNGADCEAIAVRVLRRLRAQQNARVIVMLHDLALEPDDLFGIGSAGSQRRYVVQAITRTLSRRGDGLATVQAFEVTSGVRP